MALVGDSSAGQFTEPRHGPRSHRETDDISDCMGDRRACRTNVGDHWLYRDGEHLSVRTRSSWRSGSSA